MVSPSRAALTAAARARKHRAPGPTQRAAPPASEAPTHASAASTTSVEAPTAVTKARIGFPLSGGSAGEPERAEDLAGRGEEGWKLVRWKGGAFEEEDDRLASDVEREDPEHLAAAED